MYECPTCCIHYAGWVAGGLVVKFSKSFYQDNRSYIFIPHRRIQLYVSGHYKDDSTRGSWKSNRVSKKIKPKKAKRKALTIYLRMAVNWRLSVGNGGNMTDILKYKSMTEFNFKFFSWIILILWYVYEKDCLKNHTTFVFAHPE